jgi:hypothetical protein
MAEPATACAWSDLAACLASGEVVSGFLVGVLTASALWFAGWLFKLPQRIVRRWREFWRFRSPPPSPQLIGFLRFLSPGLEKRHGIDLERPHTRGQKLRRWWRWHRPSWRGLWLRLRRCWRLLLAVVRRLLLPRG